MKSIVIAVAAAFCSCILQTYLWEELRLYLHCNRVIIENNVPAKLRATAVHYPANENHVPQVSLCRILS